jgi:hypothetical protein
MITPLKDTFDWFSVNHAPATPLNVGTMTATVASAEANVRLFSLKERGVAFCVPLFNITVPLSSNIPMAKSCKK